MDLENTAKAFERNNYKVSCFDTGTEAAAYLNQEIDGIDVCFGDSETLISIGLYEMLSKHNTVYDPKHADDFFAVARSGMQAEYFVTSVNGATEDGILINLDGTGNRVVGTLFGHKKVFLVIGKNKIAPNLEKALWRVRNVAAPKNALRHGSKTPCALNGADKCYNCNSPDRICNGLMIHYKKMRHEEMELIFVRQELGL